MALGLVFALVFSGAAAGSAGRAVAGPAGEAAASHAAGPAASPAPMSVDKLAWLAGCWSAVDGEPGSIEQWMAPAGGALLGASRTVKGSRIAGYEFMLIRETGSGGLEFVARPSGQEGAAFPAVSLDGQGVVFENPAHDFPQRVIYRLDDQGILRARIEGRSGDKVRGIDYPMRRVDCEGRSGAASP